MSHLLRRCPSTSQVERVFIYRAIQQQNPSLPARDEARSQSPDPNQSDEQIQYQSELPPPVLLKHQQQSALDTLAEVSRQQLDISSHHNPEQQSSIEDKTSDHKSDNPEEQFYAQLRDAVNAAADSPPAESAAQVQALSQCSDQSSASRVPSPVIETASTAQLEQATTEQHNLDPALEQQRKPVRRSGNDATDRDRPEHSQPVAVSTDNQHDGMPWVLTNASHNFSDIMRASKQPMWFLPALAPPIAPTSTHNLADIMAASKQPMTGCGPLQNSAKARSKFSDDRRKQVQEVRKRGACIRCRMLKKPCSEGTPCGTCMTVGSARLWKGSCLRTRLADEFTFWPFGLFNITAKAAVTEAFQGLENEATEASIEVCLHSGSDLRMKLAAKRYNQNNLAKQQAAMNVYSGEDPDLRLRAHFDAYMTSPPVYLLEEDAAELSKLEEFIYRSADLYIEQERSAFLKATLQSAQFLIRQGESATASSSAGTGRSCYPFRNQLLLNVVELWVETTILTLHKTSANTGIHIQLPTQQTEDVPPSQMGLPAENSHLIRTQICAALESRCTALSKSIMNELERRLLQRQQVSRFATFISAVILLNCIERMVGCFSSDDSPALPETPSIDLSLQASHFADLLIMLLRMRGLPPKTMADDQGRLVVVKPVLSASASPAKQLESEAAEMAASWLDPLAMSFEDLVKARDGQDPGRGENWDLRLIARALLPDVRC